MAMRCEKPGFGVTRHSSVESRDWGFGRHSRRMIALCVAGLLSATPAFAQGAVQADSGDTAWMLTATMLVLLMTIPGLALFYGGMVRAKNLLSVLMQCFAITA